MIRNFFNLLSELNLLTWIPLSKDRSSLGLYSFPDSFRTSRMNFPIHWSNSLLVICTMGLFICIHKLFSANGELPFKILHLLKVLKAHLLRLAVLFAAAEYSTVFMFFTGDANILHCKKLKQQLGPHTKLEILFHETQSKKSGYCLSSEPGKNLSDQRNPAYCTREGLTASKFLSFWNKSTTK